MSKLPEQKKSAEQIAALRNQLGIGKSVPAPGVAGPDASSTGTAESPAGPPRSEPGVVARLVPDAPLPPRADVPEVRPAEIDDDTGLPVRRRTADELAALRLRGVFETQDEALRLPVRREPSPRVTCGYLVAASAAIPIYREMPAILPLALSLAALGYAAFLFFCRPYSRHHAAFIGIVVLFVLIYAALQYFPQLRHAT